MLISGLWNVKLPIVVKRLLPVLLILFAVIIALFFNEKYNCDAMMNTYAFPYHIAIEICGLIISSLFAYIFILLETNKNWYIQQVYIDNIQQRYKVWVIPMMQE